MINTQLQEIEELITQALDAGVTLYEKDGKLAFRQKQGFPEQLKAKVVANKANLVAYFQKQAQRDTATAPELIPRADRSGRLPLSFAQEGLWFIEQLQGGRQYYMPASFCLTGNINIEAMKNAIELVIQRHESLRCRFVAGPESSGKPYIVIQDTESVPFEYVDLDLLAAPDKESHKNQHIEAFCKRPFKLDKDCLIRVLVVSDVQQHKLFFNMHHIVSDGASMTNLVAEIAAIYNANVSNTSPELPILERQYLDYAAWQQSHLNDDYFIPHINYFKSQLAGLEPLQSLPSDKPRQAIQTDHGARYIQHLPELLSQRIIAVSAAQQSSLFMWLISSFMLFVARINQQSSVVVGTPVLGRDHPELEHLIGMFVNTLVMHAKIDSKLSCEQWFAEQKARNLASLEYRALPFDKLVEQLGQSRDLSHHPLVQILFSLTQSQPSQLELNGLEVSESKDGNAQPVAVKCDLELHAQLDGQVLSLNWKYDSDLFHFETIQNWANSFAVMLEAIVQNPAMAVGSLPLLDAQHMQQLLSQTQCHEVSWPQQHSIVSLFDYQVGRCSERIAITDGKQALTYGELDQRVDALACALVAQGIQSQQLLPVSMIRSNEIVISLLAILKAGGAYVPIDPSYPQERIDYILADVGSELLLCDRQTAVQFSHLDVTCVVAEDAISAYLNCRYDAPVIRPEQLAYVIYTSGTTGKPKGVQIEHRHVVRLLFTEPSLFDFNELDVWSLFHSFCFDFSVWEMYGALLFGAKLVVVDQATAKDTQAFAQLLLKEQVSVLNQTPSAFYVLQSCMQRLLDETRQTVALRYVIFGGEALQPSKIRPWRKLLPSCQLINMYGITETTVHVTFKQLSDDDLTLGQSNIGQPIYTTSCYVLDDKQRLLPQGAVGELYVGGEGVARGYWQRPELNQARFSELSLAAGHCERLYRSGDLVRLSPNGEMTYIGRIDDQVKVRGYRIELGEIENQLRLHPWVDEVVVILNQHPVQGAYIAAFITEHQGAEFTDLRSQLTAFLKETLPDFMLPTTLSLLPRIPLTANGKVDKKALRAQHQWEDSKVEFEVPVTKVQCQVAAAFKSVLQCPQTIGLHDDFFTLGGHSLLAVELSHCLQSQYALDVSLSDIFQYPSVKALANSVNEKPLSSQETETLISPTHQTTGPLSFAQQRLWALDNLQGRSHNHALYHVPMSFSLQGELDIPAFEQAWLQVLEQHPILRTLLIVDQAGVPRQVIQPCRKSPLVVRDVSGQSPQQIEVAWLKLQRDDGQCAFDLEHDLMLRVLLLKTAPTQFKLRINLHHIACDAQSLRRLVQDLAQAYQQARGGSKQIVGMENEAALTYLDYAVWQRAHLQGLAGESHREFWQAHLAGAPKVHSLALDGARSNQSLRLGAQYESYFDRSLCQQITAQCQSLGVSHFMWLHTLFSLCVARISQVSDVVIGSPFSGRENAQLKHIVGFFINVLPIRTQFTEKMSLHDVLLQQKAHILAVHTHQSLPFEQIVELCEQHKDLSHHSLFQISFAFDPKEDSQLLLDGLEACSLEQPQTHAKFELELTCSEQSDGIRLNWVFDSELFNYCSIKNLADAFTTFVQSAVTDIMQPIVDIPLLADNRWREHMLCGETHAINSPSILTPLWAHQNSQLADKVALIDPQGNSTSYGELLCFAEQLAAYLVSAGLQAQERVMVCLPAGSIWVKAMLAVMRADGCYVPVDPEYPLERLRYIAQDSQCKFVLTNSKCSDLLKLSGIETQALINLDTLNLDAFKECASRPLPTNSEQLAYVIYTSGTTGQPKGVMNKHRGLMNLCQWHQRTFLVNAQSVSTQTASVAFDAAAWEVWPYLVSGATLLFVAKAHYSDARLMTQTMDEHGVTHSFLATPVAQAVMADHEFSPKTLRYLLVGGDKLGQVDMTRHGFKLVNNYGPTESAVVTTSGIVDLNLDVPDIGLPIDNTQLLILNEQRQQQPAGAIGELYIAGASLASGYLNRQDLTDERFELWTAPSGETLRVYRSGDLVRQLACGRVAYVGRNDDQVKLRGYRIELDEIAAQLSKLPGIEQATVLLCDDDGARPRLIAFVTQTGQLQERALSAKLDAQLRQVLPAHMLPSEYLVLANMPLTSHGKLDKGALRARVGKVVTSTLPVASQMQTTASAHSDILLSIYRELLKCPTLGLEDDFFAMGGDSILSIQIATRARVQGVELAVSDVFTYPSVAQLSAHIGQSQTLNDVQSNYVASCGTATLLPAQQWFFEQQFEEPTHWNQAVMLGLDKGIEASQLSAVITALISRHDSLRLVVNHSSSQNMHFSEHVSATSLLHVSDLSNASHWQGELQRLCEQYQQSLCFNGEPLIRFLFVKSGLHSDKNRLCIIAHHLLVDGVSWRILLEDLSQGIVASSNGQATALPCPPVSLQQVAKAFVDHAEHTAKSTDWQLTVQAARTQVLFEIDTSITKQYALGKRQLQLSSSMTQALLTHANQPYGTNIQVLLLSALHLTVNQLYGAQSHVVMMEGHGRDISQNSIDSSQTLGWMTAMYPLHLYVNSNALSDIICQVKETLAATQNKASDFGALRYFHPDPAVREALHLDTNGLIFFNYLGQLDSVIQTGSVISDVTESSGTLISANNHCFYAMQMTSAIQDACLSVQFEFDTQRVSSDAAEAFVQHLHRAIDTVVLHCTQQQVRHYTQSDFSLLPACSERKLNQLIAKYPIDSVEDIYPLSPLQQGMWFQTQLAKANDESVSPYLEQCCFTFAGEFDCEAFVYAWRQVIKQHSILRSRFSMVDGQPVQVVLRESELPVEIVACEEVAVDAQAEYMKVKARQAYDQGPALDGGHSMRVQLVPMSAQRVGFIWTYHHMIMDGWSLPVLFSEILRFYRARIAGYRAAIQQDNFADFIGYIQARDIQKETCFWQSYLAELDTPMLISEHLNSGATSAIEYIEQHEVLNESLCNAIGQSAAELGLTSNHMIQGVFAYWLSVCCGRKDVMFGQTIAGRPAQLSNMADRVGPYINTQVVYTEVDMNMSVATFLQQFKENVTALSEHPHTSLSDVHRWSRIDNSQDLFDVLYVFENYPTSPLTQGPDLPFDIIGSDYRDQTHYPLTLVVGGEQQLSLTLCYQSNLLTRSHGAQFVAMLSHLLTQVCANPQRKLNELAHCLTPQDNTAFATFELNSGPFESDSNTLHQVAREQTLPAAFAQTAAAYGEETAIAYFADKQDSLSRTLSYQELDKRSNQLAHWLVEQFGHHLEQPIVGLCLAPSPSLIVAILGVLKAGAAYVPMTSGLPQQRKQQIVESCNASLVLADQVIWQAENVPCSTYLYGELNNLLTSYSELPVEREMTSADLGYVIYTSGTTGVPKGVMVEQRSILNYVNSLSAQYGISPQDNYLQFASFSFDVFAEEVFCTLLNGATLVMSEQSQLLDTQRLCQLTHEADISLMSLPTAYWHQLCAAPLQFNPGLRLITIGGEQMQLAALKAWQQHQSSSIRLINAYGPTEATISATLQEVTQWEDDDIAIGRPVAGLQLHVLDAQLRAVPDYVVGELYISGAGLARGYLGDEQKTAKAFIRHPESGLRLYKTGDLVKVNTRGEVVFLGRRDGQVKVRGYRIELADIESQLMTIDGIASCAVVVRQDGSDNEQLVAFVEGLSSCQDMSQVTLELSTKLPSYMVPNIIEPIDVLPHTASGKLDRRALTVRAQALSLHTDAVEAPQSILEKRIAAQFGLLLKVDKVGLDDDFFALGGHSLLIMQLVAEIQSQLHLNVPIAAILQHSSVRKLASYIDSQLSSQSQQSDMSNTLMCLQQGEIGFTPLVLIAGAGGLLLSFVKLVNMLDKRIPVYGLQPDAIADNPELIGNIHLTAKHYLDALQSQTEFARAHIVAHSFGAFIGYELAQLSQSSGFTCDSLTILDTPRPSKTKPIVDAQQIDKFMLQDLCTFFCISPRQNEIEHYIQMAGMAKLAILSEWLAQKDVQISVQQLSNFYQVYKAQVLADVAIDKPLIDTKVTVIKAENTTEFEGRAVKLDMGWQRVVANLDTLEITGDHLSILQKTTDMKALVEQIEDHYILHGKM
ncbi:non-ribosomal peptide synthetase [Pseudoalteromonas luteoviolacea]|uniref:non-ribosomal peptide synthetase n=1 Tax=Pseudoalteromonas luteoviolacea TaxID=43657 RepID=UPI001B364B88|nr:amino acid adenylation domain-containing protein [Pseudoalteromonas luteoviolacea]